MKTKIHTNMNSNCDIVELRRNDEEEPKINEASESEFNEPLLPVIQACSGNDQCIIYEIRSDNLLTYSYVVTNPKESQSECVNPKEANISDNIVSNDTEVISSSGLQYTISFEIPIENDQKDICKKKNPQTKRALAEMKRTLARKKLADAVAAVVNSDMTIGKAAKAFEVTKSTLWKEVNKHTDHRKKKVDDDLNKQIGDRICAGESLSEIARSLHVAKSTIHLHKVRLAKAGQLPSNVIFKPPVDKMKQLAIKERIIRAFRAIRVNGMSLRLASAYFSVPRSTLWTHIKRFKASQKKQVKDTPDSNYHPEKDMNDEFNEMSLEETSEEEDCTEEDRSPDAETETEAEIEDLTETGESTSDVQSTTTEGEYQEDFHLLDFYCKQHAADPSEEGDFFISFDFETFEKYVKTELED